MWIDSRYAFVTIDGNFLITSDSAGQRITRVSEKPASDLSMTVPRRETTLVFSRGIKGMTKQVPLDRFNAASRLIFVIYRFPVNGICERLRVGARGDAVTSM